MTTQIQPLSVGFETRQDTCPKCNGSSTATRIITCEKDLSKAWNRYLCEACQDRAAAERRSSATEASPGTVTTARMKQLGVPPKYAAVSLENFDVNGAAPGQRSRLDTVMKRAIDFLADWPASPVLSLFVGDPGTGKGHIAWSIARAVVESKQGSARVCVLSDVIRDLREAWSSNEEGGLSEAARLSRYRSVDLLVIDEVSNHAFYGQPRQHLYDLVAWREVHNMPTIITTNDSGEDIATTLGPALSSRVLGGGPIWYFGEGDYRIKRAEKIRIGGHTA
ncbi:MAG: ATP-binding protein [Gemmatimonadetes bacterium]|nr:ATP-binding protein [Gemmatimonadota bacterium]